MKGFDIGLWEVQLHLIRRVFFTLTEPNFKASSRTTCQRMKRHCLPPRRSPSPGRSSAKASKPPHGRQSPHGTSSQRRITPSIPIWSDSWPNELVLRQKRLKRATSALFPSLL